MKNPLTPQRILTSDGRHTPRAAHATPQQAANAVVLCERVNALLTELGIDTVTVNDGFRDASVTYGAAHSAHKEGQAVDLKDVGRVLSSRIGKALLLKYGLRREDNDYTAGRDGQNGWCHLDTREPHGTIFKP